MAYVGKHIRRPSAKRIALEWTIIVIAAIAVGLALRLFAFTVYRIPSGSMETTIMTGDRVFAEKVSYHFSSPERGDIVVFTDPEDDSRYLIKRCIATEGQTITLEDGRVCVDGVALEEPYTHGLPSYELDQGVTFPYTVEEGHIWVMGDNRTDSKDSRYFGDISVEDVQAHALFVVWPFSDISKL